MSVIIRETFIGLHSSNVLQRLADEFRERYKGYKIPLQALGSLRSKLPKAAKVLQLKDGKVLEEVPAEDVATLLSNSSPADEPAKDDTFSALDAEGEEADCEAEDFGDEEEAPKKKRKSKETKAKDSSSLEDKFVDMTDFLPAVPKKGVFDVDRVKNSLYFFS